jgi:two-component system chemotaxis response regulator CheY
MCSAMGQQSIVIEALKSGAIDFVVKPFDSNRVKAAVQKLVGQ